MENILTKFFLQVSAQRNVSTTITNKKALPLAAPEQIISYNKGDYTKNHILNKLCYKHLGLRASLSCRIKKKIKLSKFCDIRQ